VKQQRARLREQVAALAAQAAGDLRAACDAYLAAFDDFDASRTAADALIAALEADGGAARRRSRRARPACQKDLLDVRRDGWAYDIGFRRPRPRDRLRRERQRPRSGHGGLLNTGGQSSKARRSGAVAQFASAGKRSRRRISARSS
jgi:pyruvate-ferredoxin/flavodoxin oxidoreductase